MLDVVEHIRAGVDVAFFVALNAPERAQLQEEAQTEARQTLERARREVALATETAKREIHDYAGQLAVAVAERILGREIAAADHARLIADSIAAIDRSEN